MKKGLVSVFIPSYNYERYLGDAIDSILAQTYEDWELIIVDDASADSSPEIIQRYQRRYPGRIRSTLLETNVGQSEATNIGLRQANGEFVALLAADDVARPERLARGVELLHRRPEVAAAFSRVAYLDGDGRPITVQEDVFNRPFEDMRWRILLGNFLCGTSIVARAAALFDVGGYNRTLGYVEDYDLWLRLLDRFELERVDDIWVDYRLHGSNLSLAANRNEQRLGPLYESVATAIRAMRRWPLDRLHAFRTKPGTKERQREVASVQLRLARCSLQLDKNFFQQVRDAGLPSPGIGIAAAYEFVLDALQNDPANDEANKLLTEIYAALGDSERAAGGKSITLGQMQAKQASVQDSRAPIPLPPAEAKNKDIIAYDNWVGLFSLTRAEAAQYDCLATSGGLAARFHLVVILIPGQENHLIATIKSLTAQLHTNLLLTIIAESDAPSGFVSERLRWHRANGQPLVIANHVLLQEEASWVGVLECGDQLADSALLQAAAAIGHNPRWQALYTDDDDITSDGHLNNPRLRPDFDITLARSTFYLDGLVLVRWDTFAALGGFTPDMGRATNYDLLLRVSERDLGKQEPIIGHLSGPLLHRIESRIPDTTACLKAIQAHLGRTKNNSIVVAGTLANSWAIRYPISGEPLVSVIVPTRDRLSLLSRCLESLLEKTAYQHYEIVVVDHGSQSPETANYLRGLAGLGEGRLRVARQSGPFSLSALFNVGAKVAKGEHFVFLHDDVAALHPEWLENLIGHVLRPGIGAASARLLSSNGRLQHAGIVLGLSGLADLVGEGAAIDDPGYLDRYAHDHEVAAASAACLAVSREAFNAVGGFSEIDFPIFLADVDLCLRLGEAGWKIVWTPHATLLHDGPMKLSEGIRSTPDTAAKRKAKWDNESDRLLKRWLPTLARDPHYSRMHFLHTPAFRTCGDASLARDLLPWKPLRRVFAQPADRYACGYYRISAPLQAMMTSGKVQGWDSMSIYNPIEMERIDPDVVVLQRPYTDEQIAFLEQTSRYSQSLRLFDMDDLVTLVPKNSVHHGAFPADVATRLKRAAALCDRLVVSTGPLAQAISKWHDDIRIVPNHLPKDPWMQLAPARRTGARPRVGWAGALGHEGDLALVFEVVTALANEVEWIFMGTCPTELRRFMKEIHVPVDLAHYPAALASLTLDVAIAPLEINAFNEAKSHLKLLEYGALGYPVVCSDIVPYQGVFPVTRVRNRPQDWIKAIRTLAFDPALAAAEGDRLRDHVRDQWMLEDHLDKWLSAWLP